MNKQEIENNYEFRLLNRLLKQEFNWIVNIEVDETKLGRFSTIELVNVNIDPFKLIENDDNIRIRPWVLIDLKNDGMCESIDLKSFFYTDYSIAEFEETIESIFDKIKRTSGLSQKLKSSKIFKILSYVIKVGNIENVEMLNALKKP